MWIDAVSGLLRIGHVNSQSNKCYRITERTSAVGTRHLLHPDRFLRIEECHRRVRELVS